jgi:hypothetical protein
MGECYDNRAGRDESGTIEFNPEVIRRDAEIGRRGGEK